MWYVAAAIRREKYRLHYVKHKILENSWNEEKNLLLYVSVDLAYLQSLSLWNKGREASMRS